MTNSKTLGKPEPHVFAWVFIILDSGEFNFLNAFLWLFKKFVSTDIRCWQLIN